jgi:hypothetical protein
MAKLRDLLIEKRRDQCSAALGVLFRDMVVERNRFRRRRFSAGRHTSRQFTSRDRTRD